MLEPEQIEKLRGMLLSSGWREIAKPLLAERGHGFVKDALRMPSERSAPYKDMDDLLAITHLRGRIVEIEWLLSALENEVKNYDLNRRMEELQRAEQGLPPENPTG